MFAIVVVLHHTGNIFQYKPFPAPGGALAVEFFLLLSGFFMMTSLEKIRSSESFQEKNCGELALKFTLKKIRAFLPYVIISVIIVYTVYAIIQDLSFSKAFEGFLYSVYEMLLLPLTGIKGQFNLVHLWYLDCFIIVIPILAYLLLRFHDFFKNIFIFLFPLLIYGFLILNYGLLVKWSNWIGFAFIGVFRVSAGICLGCVCYCFCKSAAQIKFTKFGRMLITIIGLLCFAISISTMLFFRASKLNVLQVILMMIGVIIMLSKQSYLPNLLNRPCFSILGKLSLPLYTSHWVFREVFKKYVITHISSPAIVVCLFVLSAIVLAALLLILIEHLQRIKVIQRAKKLIVSN